MKRINTEKYLVEQPIKPSGQSTSEDFGASEKKLKKKLEEIRKKLGKFQNTLYTHGKYSV